MQSVYGRMIVHHLELLCFYRVYINWVVDEYSLFVILLPGNILNSRFLKGQKNPQQLPPSHVVLGTDLGIQLSPGNLGFFSRQSLEYFDMVNCCPVKPYIY